MGKNTTYHIADLRVLQTLKKIDSIMDNNDNLSPNDIKMLNSIVEQLLAHDAEFKAEMEIDIANINSALKNLFPHLKLGNDLQPKLESNIRPGNKM